jgi:hypothetical protein
MGRAARDGNQASRSRPSSPCRRAWLGINGLSDVLRIDPNQRQIYPPASADAVLLAHSAFRAVGLDRRLARPARADLIGITSRRSGAASVTQRWPTSTSSSRQSVTRQKS